MKKLRDWIVTILYLPVFLSVLLLFHPLQIVARALGSRAHERVLDWLLYSILATLRMTGATYHVTGEDTISTDRPLILISNHQSLYDIPLIGWTFRAHRPKYIAKKELARGIPSVSYNLRNGGSVLIDRSDPRQAIPAIEEFGRVVQEKKVAAVIFPEGTRARDGVMKQFKSIGVQKLISSCPNALIVPITIEGSWRLMRYGFLPIPYGEQVSMQILPPIERESMTPKEIVEAAEKAIREALDRARRED